MIARFSELNMKYHYCTDTFERVEKLEDPCTYVFIFKTSTDEVITVKVNHDSFCDDDMLVTMMYTVIDTLGLNKDEIDDISIFDSIFRTLNEL